jgi:isopentenyl-diphosphate delta-isomerase
MSEFPETPKQFEQRKQDHIRTALDPRSQAEGHSGLNHVQLIPEALPEFNFAEVDPSTSFFSRRKLSAPFFISSMTAGHAEAALVNSRLAALSADKQILMGVGSQRRELTDPEAFKEWQSIRAVSPKALLLGNLGIAQVIRTKTENVRKLVDSLQAEGLFIHLNALQECLQPEGTPQFRGGFQAIEALVKTLGVPVIIKEVGCGFSATTLQRLYDVGVTAVDVSGFGGTHWGRIEGYRSSETELLHQVAKTFENWGLSTVESLLNAKQISGNKVVWASGGVRDGLQTAKLLAMGSELVGLAQPWLKSALDGESAVAQMYEKLLLEVKIAMFCSGIQKVEDFKKRKVWKWHEH